MRIAELRIGNIIEAEFPINYPQGYRTYNGIHEILGINSTNKTVLLRISKSETKWLSVGKYIKSIELTDELLLTLRFENKNSSYSIENYKYEFSLFFYDVWNLYYKEKENYGDAEIELSGYWSIHQLQNLFYALTGEELKLKTT
ncbi:hypothetical protein HZP59_08915 [Elizabethkingia anophelis]|nr:hypothetical protein [Elizabethkingia anophelis]